MLTLVHQAHWRSVDAFVADIRNRKYASTGEILAPQSPRFNAATKRVLDAYAEWQRAKHELSLIALEEAQVSVQRERVPTRAKLNIVRDKLTY